MDQRLIPIRLLKQPMRRARLAMKVAVGFVDDQLDARLLR